MKVVNDLIKVPELNQTMQQMSKEMMKAGLIEETMGEMMDDAFDTDDIEEDADAEVDKVGLETFPGCQTYASPAKWLLVLSDGLLVFGTLGNAEQSCAALPRSPWRALLYVFCKSIVNPSSSKQTCYINIRVGDLGVRSWHVIHISSRGYIPQKHSTSSKA